MITKRPKWNWPQICSCCKEKILYNNMPAEYVKVHGSRKACKYCNKWFHTNCLLDDISCFDCLESCTEKEMRSIFMHEAHNIVNGKDRAQTFKDESRDIVALQLWMTHREKHNFDEKEISRVMRFSSDWVEKTISIMRQKGVISPENKVMLDVKDEEPLTLYVAFILNSLLVQEMVERKDETYSPH